MTTKAKKSKSIEQMDLYEQEKCRTIRYRKIKRLLQEYYNFDHFKPSQYKVINRIINKQDTIAIFPTGGGKSLCYVMPGLYFDAVTIVISPLIALMNDQCTKLKGFGIPCKAYSSTTVSASKSDHTKQKIIDCKYSIVFVAPESLAKLTSTIERLYEDGNLCLIAIDEAHCITTHGLSFRNNYRVIGSLREMLQDVPFLAVTATATESTIADICKTLLFDESADSLRERCTNAANSLCKRYTDVTQSGEGVCNADYIIKESFDRPNLFISINKCIGTSPDDYDGKFLDILKNNALNTKSTIIYCNYRNQVEKIQEILIKHKYKSVIYHSGLSNPVRAANAHSFMTNKVNFVIATIAFGMGIDKDDVACIIHLGFPSSIEIFYQEIGRAGRNGKKAQCYCLYRERDYVKQLSIVSYHGQGTTTSIASKVSISHSNYGPEDLHLNKKSKKGDSDSSDDEDDADKVAQADAIKHEHTKTQMDALEDVKALLETPTCKRKHLLAYFGEVYSKSNCGACTSCTTLKTRFIFSKNHDFALSLVRDVESGNVPGISLGFGTSAYIKILTGSKDKGLKEALKKSKYYGISKNTALKSQNDWKSVFSDLVNEKYLVYERRKNASGFFFNILRLGSVTVPSVVGSAGSNGVGLSLLLSK